MSASVLPFGDPQRRARLIHSRLQIETACLLQSALANLDELGETIAAAHTSFAADLLRRSMAANPGNPKRN